MPCAKGLHVAQGNYGGGRAPPRALPAVLPLRLVALLDVRLVQLAGALPAPAKPAADAAAAAVLAELLGALRGHSPESALGHF